MFKDTLKMIIAVFIAMMITIAYGLLVPRKAAAKNWLSFGFGFLTAYTVHEGGHVIASHATGTDMDWSLSPQGGSFVESAKDDLSGLIINGSGLVAQLLSSEVILQGDFHNDFTDGMMAWNTVNPLFYSLDYWLNLGITNWQREGEYHGDLAGIERYSDDTTANLFAISDILISLSQGYRYIKPAGCRYRVNLGNRAVFISGNF